MKHSCLILLLFIKSHLFSQNKYLTETINSTNGLSSDYVSGIEKKDGNLYLATRKGICLFDGYTFIINQQTKGAVASIVKYQNDLYFYKENSGVFTIDNILDSPRFYLKPKFTDSIPSNDHFNNLFLDKKENIWSSDYNNIKYYNHLSKKTKIFSVEKNNLNQLRKVSYIELPKNTLWIFTEKGVYTYEYQSNIFKKNNSISKSLSNLDAILLNKDSIALTTYDNKIIFYNIKNKKSKTIELEKTYQIKKYKNNKILLYNENQLISLNLKDFRKEKIYDTRNTINTIFFDKETDIIWLGTNKGLIKLVEANKNIKTINIPENTKPIISIDEQKNKLWFTNGTNYVYSYSLDKINRYSIKSSEKLTYISKNNNTLLVNSQNCIYVLKKNNLQPILSTHYKIKKCLIDSKNRLWILPLEKENSVHLYDFNTLKELHYKNNNDYWKYSFPNDIKESSTKKIWLASWMPRDYGISYFDEKEFKFKEISTKKFNNFNQFIGDYYSQASVVKNGQMLFSGYGGWNKVTDNGKIVFRYGTDFFTTPNDNIQGITEDNNGNIWFASAEGLHYFNFKTQKIINLSKIDGLLDNDLTNGFCKIDKDHIAISSDNKIQIIDLKKVLQTQLINCLRLNRITVDEKVIPLTNVITLEPNYNKVDLEFSAQTFSEKNKIIYRYKFEDDKKWNYIGNIPKLTFIRLTPGKYNLTIEVGDNLNNWQTKKLQLKIIVKTPFYKTIWFLSFIGLIIFFIAYIINSYLLKQEKIKGILKRKIKENEMQTLRSQMNPHFLFNSLNSINSYIIENKKKEASKYLTKFAKLMRNILDNSKHSTITLEKELHTLSLYLELESVRLEGKLNYEIVIEKNVDAESIKIPPLIIQPFVENAIWHGIHHKTSEGFISIKVEYLNSNLLIIHIIDDGVGRVITKSLKKEDKSSYGINITTERLKQINERNDCEIIDLYTKNLAKGTHVKLLIYNPND